MSNAKAENRTRLIRAATKLTYLHGFGKTALADIAKEASVPLGNVYYYFKTKDAIGEAIVEQHLVQLKEQLQKLAETNSPVERLCGFIRMTVLSSEMVARSGCPIGTFVSEVHKGDGPLVQKTPAVFAELLRWMEAQFQSIGAGADSRGLAVHLLSALQGATVLAHTFHDPGISDAEAARLEEWIRTLATTTNKRGSR
jgi:TetR/AcrR family transcriptional regulator, transcriptional repressor for nem operon